MISRMLKINSLMKRELSQIIGYELRDPHLGFITVVGIEVTRDLRQAKAFVSIMGDEVQKKKSLRGLLKARGFIQKELGSRLSMKFIPSMKFVLDNSLDHAMHIEEVLKKIKEDEVRSENDKSS
jgi:ribosome-binding factor A